MFTKLKIKTLLSGCDPDRHAPQIFDLLQLSRKERECRIVCRAAIAKVDAWKKSRTLFATPGLWNLRRIEGMILRRRAEEALLFYRLVRNGRVRLFEDYINRLPARNNLCRSAS